MLVREKLREDEYFSDVESRIARYVLEREDEIREESVRQMAAKLYVAPSSIVRFCRKLGYDGFNDFKEEFLKETEYLSSNFHSIDPNFPFEKTDKENVIANKTAILYEEIIKDCQTLLSQEQIRQAVDILWKSKEIYICTAGPQVGLAEVFRDKMMKIGRLVQICSHSDEAYYQACYCSPESCFIIISYTGETERGIKAAGKARTRGLPVIAVTSYGNNSLTDYSDCCLYVSTREKLTRNLGSFGMSVSVMYLLDVVYAAYFSRDYEQHYENKTKHTEEYERGEFANGGRHSSNPILKD
jgi:DNA-binding MurR/RpiR family transcriptional regulator